MSLKSIQYVFPETAPHMVGDGFRVINYIPGSMNLAHQVSPYLMLDYGPPFQFPPSKNRKGVGEHPHRGFETVTIVYEGEIAHRDSSGGGGIIGPDEVQWMTAASGVLHDEFQTEELSRNGGTTHMAQIWVNLPARDKMSAPKYQNLTRDNIPVIQLDDQGSVARVIAGDFEGTRGAASTFTPLQLVDIRLKPGARLRFRVPEGFNSMVLVTKGRLTAQGKQPVSHKDFILFGTDGDELEFSTDEEAFLLLLTGEPILEPIARYGPFVMNTREEIMQAFDDFNNGKFGVLS